MNAQSEGKINDCLLSDGHSFFETISRNFIYFLFKLPAQHTVTDILDIWVRE